MYVIYLAKCNTGEKYTTCGGCEGTCKNPNPICLAYCRTPGCYCDIGFVRHHGVCISESSCQL